MSEPWVIAWIENYHVGERVEPRFCASLEEAVGLALMWEESDDHFVLDIETPDGVLTVEQQRAVEERLRVKWARQHQILSAELPPVTRLVEARIPDVVPGLEEDWRIWGSVASCRTEGEANQHAARWIAAIGADRVRIRAINGGAA